MELSGIVSLIAVAVIVLVIIAVRRVEAEGRAAWAATWCHDPDVCAVMLRRVGPVERRKLQKALDKARDESR